MTRMNSSIPFWVQVFERLAALLMLFVSLMTLMVIALIMHLTSSAPILLSDEIVTRKGTLAHRYRFRTAGKGTAAFRAMGRILRTYSLDEFPALWNVARGELRLSDVLKRETR